MCCMTFDLTSNQVACDDSSCFAINFDKVEHLMATVHFDFTSTDLPIHRRISSEQQLLTSLSFGIKGARDEYPTKRAVVEQSPIIPCEGNTLSDTLVNDVGRYFCKTIYVGFSRTIIAAFDGIVKQAMNRVAIALVVFSGIYSPLCCDRVCTTWRILKAKRLDVITQFCEGSRSRATSQTRTNHDYIDQTFVGWTDQADVVFVTCPFISYWTFRDMCVEFGHVSDLENEKSL